MTSSPALPRSAMLATAAIMALTVLPASAKAAGLISRVWVSGHGADQAGCGAPSAPCRSLQYAHDQAVAPGGEIDILDPAGYGAITITKSVSIVNDGVGTAGVQATSGNAILIGAGPADVIYLRGLNIDGVGRQGSNGVFFSSGASLTIVNCVVRNFAQDGVLLSPTSAAASVVVTDTLIANNHVGLAYSASGAVADHIAIEHLTAVNNDTVGVSLFDGATGKTGVSVDDSVADNNGVYGFEIETINASPMSVDLIGDRIANNGQDGLWTIGLPAIVLSKDVFRGNVFFGAAGDNDNEIVTTYQDNVFQGNGSGPCCDIALQSTPATFR